MNAIEILKYVKEMLEVNTRVNWNHADYTPEEEFQCMLDSIKEMEEGN
tara:strand:- start:284 stop:427 length:144 start_codon:yes stop_codon:yes gene_type:complete